MPINEEKAMEVEVLGEAGRWAAIAVKCKCGETAYAVVERWRIPSLHTKEHVIAELNDLRKHALEEANREHIRQATREQYLKVADELDDLIKKLSEKGESN